MFELAVNIQQMNAEQAEYNIMRELNVKETEQVNGGSMYGAGYVGAAIAVGATTFRTAYETATFFGAGKAGRWLGRYIYDITH